ncbi:MAG: bifunctional oligoribonuclease/PAP phosphatase NrnA [Bacteroidales bacterium]|nr:bifunctional oligoribonuclease/PAP phosphatase NrnA [Bacteroidales bacterium]
MFDTTTIREVKQLLLQPRDIVLVSHKNPDGDTIGAALGLMHYLRQLGHRVEALVPNEFPSFYRWLPGSDQLLIFDQKAKEVKEKLNNASLVFCVDFNSMDRTGNMASFLQEAPGIKIVIDHHLQPSDEFQHYFSVVETSSTGELVYSFIEAMDHLQYLNKEIALALYTAIMTDTGSFSFACNQGRTYEIVARLIDLGVDPTLVHRLVYDTFTESRLRLLGHSISNKMRVWNELHAAAIYLDKKDLSDFSYQVGDTEGVVNYPLSMEQINLSILLTEKNSLIRMSFRSKGGFDCNLFARKHYNGGGHKNAAGGNTALPMDQALQHLEETLSQYKNELGYKIGFE